MMRMIKNLVILLLFPLLSTSQVRTQLDTLGISDFSTKIAGTDQFLNLFTEKTVDLVNSTGRFLLVDLTSTKTLDKVIERSQENYKGNWIDDKSKINPKVVLVGQVNVLKFIRIASNSSPGYKSNVQFILKIIETESSKILDSYEFTGVGSSISLTQEGSIQEAINSMSGDLSGWIKSKFPIKLSLVKITKQSSKYIDEVILSGGSKLRINNGDQFDIIFLDNSFSPPIPQILGSGSIINILGENYSSFKIDTGDKNQITQLLIQSKDQVIFKSK